MQKDTARLHKILLKRQSDLGISIGSIRSCVSQSAVPLCHLSQALGTVLSTMLSKQGWVALGLPCLVYLERHQLVSGKIVECAAIWGLQVVLEATGHAYLLFTEGNPKTSATELSLALGIILAHHAFTNTRADLMMQSFEITWMACKESCLSGDIKLVSNSKGFSASENKRCFKLSKVLFSCSASWPFTFVFAVSWIDIRASRVQQSRVCEDS